MTNILDKTFASLLSQLLNNCEEQGVIMVPYEKLRSPQEQAQLWVQGRTLIAIQTEIQKFMKEKAFFLAECLENVEMKGGKIITNALPGFSWHQWGEAVDCYWLKDGRPNWNLDLRDENNQNGYVVYAGEAKKLGLEAGFYWKKLLDAVHVQLQQYSSPQKIYSISEINEIMKDFYN